MYSYTVNAVIRCTLCPVSSNGNILQNYIIINITITILTLINQSYSDFQFYLYSCVYMWVCKFYTILSPVYSCIHHQSRQTVLTIQGFLTFLSYLLYTLPNLNPCQWLTVIFYLYVISLCFW